MDSRDTDSETAARAELAESLLETVAKSDLREIGIDALDVAVDAMLADGVLRDLPIVGWIEKSRRAYRSITEALFLKKVWTFLRGASTASASERQQFLDQLDNSEINRRRVGETLVLLLDRHERFEKSHFLGRLFACRMKGQITEEQFNRLAAALDRAEVEDLAELARVTSDRSKLSRATEEGLARAGLASFTIDSRPAGAWSVYALNELGRLFVKCAFERSDGGSSAADA